MRLTGDQLEFECSYWKRLLEFIQLENAYCKTRLSELIRTADGDSEFMEQAEFYNNYYLQQDTHLQLLKHDVRNFARLVDREKFEDGAIIKQVQGTRHKLGHEIEKLENEFSQTKKRFNSFLAANS